MSRELSENDASRASNRDSNEQTTFKECGGLLRDISFGVVTTPNFPDPFPVPIYCRWIIEAKPGNVIALYLTQFYLKEGFKATEYAFFSDNSLSIGKKDFGSIMIT
ncbi:Procollagen C-endopeptidase enhancer 2-like protein [Leptotrombidium deliense]|uniref:Procollagen C-endopeptidase enhancer 2-like protein n=1 Tax=Leptotrombidium deliense TaxID=299467 RepID=A0A443SGN4_9ACAR|nr:Procollagen C-endopeptidase enhancer 2-like protein [Leptotrombidium deliense]